MSGVCRHWWENSLVMGSGNVSFYLPRVFLLWNMRGTMQTLYFCGSKYVLYIWGSYITSICCIYIYIWSRPCESLHAIESKNLSMLLRVLSPWEREGSDAAAGFFFNLDIANTHMSKFLKTLCHTYAQKNICLLTHALVTGSKNMSFLVSDLYSLGSLGDVPWFLPGGCLCFLLCNKIILFVLCVYIYILPRVF